jgi:DNA-directed RNA polymerase subunit RPC12/RpoP
MEGIEVLNIKKFCCPAQNCLKEYISKFNLKAHFQYKHLGIKKFECSVCGKKFVTMMNMKEHLFTHTGEKPYKCSSCGMKFRQSSFLSLHKKSHSAGYKKSLEYVKNIMKEVNK